MSQIQIRTAADTGALIRERRRLRGWGQADLAKTIGVSRLWVNQVERGKPGASLGLILRALNALDARLMIDLPGSLAAAPAGDLAIAATDIDAIVDRARRLDRG